MGSNRLSEFIIIGDFNCHVGKGYNDRAWGKTCSNGAKLLTLIDSYNMTIADLDNNSIGPTYTFLNTRGDLSYIDHCVLSQRLVNDVIQCSILDDCTPNTKHKMMNTAGNKLPRPKFKNNKKSYWS